jgi:hypothetical protein
VLADVRACLTPQRISLTLPFSKTSVIPLK